MGFVDNVILLRCVIVGFLAWSLLCLYVAYRHPELPRTLFENVLGRIVGDTAKSSEHHTNWWMAWFMPFFFLVFWIAYEVWLKRFVA